MKCANRLANVVRAFAATINLWHTPITLIMRVGPHTMSNLDPADVLYIE